MTRLKDTGDVVLDIKVSDNYGNTIANCLFDDTGKGTISFKKYIYSFTNVEKKSSLPNFLIRVVLPLIKVFLLCARKKL